MITAYIIGALFGTLGGAVLGVVFGVDLYIKPNGIEAFAYHRKGRMYLVSDREDAEYGAKTYGGKVMKLVEVIER